MRLSTDISLKLGLFEVSRSDRFKDGWVHKKTVPYAIFAQVLKGQYEIVCPPGKALINPGEAFLTPPSVPLEITHRHIAGEMEARWMHFNFHSSEGLALIPLLEMPLRVPASQADELGNIIDKALELKGSKELPLWTEARHMELAFGAFRGICAISELKAEFMERLQDSRFAKLCKAIRENPEKSCSVPSMAKIAGVSPSRLFSYLRDRHSTSPMELAREIKLGLAAEMLLQGDFQLREIAERLGFANQFHFSASFKRLYGESPKDYRKKRNGALG